MSIGLSGYLQPTFFIDSDHPAVSQYATKICQQAKAETPLTKAIALYYAVRDEIRYDPYDLHYRREAMRASSVLAKGSGYCVSKAVLLAALCRSQLIPARLGFADVTNHLSTERLRRQMGTDLFVFHGYTELFLNEQWVKATPAFNLSLCTRFQVKPLEFDGRSDSIFHPFDQLGRQHMEYVKDRGHYADLPFEEMFATYVATYPDFMEHFGSGNNPAGDFAKEATAENCAREGSPAAGKEVKNEK